MRNRKAKDSIEDQSQDKMIKHVDLDSYIQQSNSRHANNQDLKSLDSIREKGLIVIDQNADMSSNQVLTQRRTKEKSTGGLEKDFQYVSDVVFSKVSPTSD